MEDFLVVVVVDQLVGMPVELLRRQEEPRLLRQPFSMRAGEREGRGQRVNPG